MAEYGFITDVDTIKQQMRDYNRDYNNRRTWAGMETNLALSAQAANTVLTSDYSSAMSQAYNAARVNQRAIEQSGIVGSSKQSLLQQNQTALEEAYNTYISNFQSGQQQITNEYIEGLNQIDEALTQEAENTIAYKKAHEDYLQYLYYQYQLGENTLFDSKQWSKFLVDEDDGQGNVTSRLMTMNELYEPAFNEYVDENGIKQKEWTSLVDDEGNLTMKGVDFFDQLSNVVPSEALGNSSTFGRFLAETDTDFLINEYGYTKSEAEKIVKQNSELLKWSQSYNPYNYTVNSTNKGTFRTMVGMMSTDDVYSFAERWGGMSREQIDSLFTEYKDAAEALSKKMSKAKDKGRDITKEVTKLVDSAHDLAKDLGIDNAININWEQLQNDALKYYSGTVSQAEMAGTWFGNYGTFTVTGLGAGATLGSVVPGVGTAVGAAIGTAVGTITGIVGGSIAVDNQRKQNKKMAENSKELFDNMLAQMVSFAAYNKRQKEIEFMQKNA